MKKVASYPYYLEAIEKIGSFSSSEEIMVRDLELKSSVITTGYWDIKQLGFPGTLIQFFCWISLEKILSLLKEGWDKNKKDKNFFEILIVVLASDYKNSRRLLAANPKMLSFTLKKIPFASKKERKDFGRWVRSLF